MITITEEMRYRRRACRVQIRRGEGWNVKPGAEALDGKVFTFMPGWPITDEDSSIYVGEWAMLLQDPEFWAEHPDAPSWIASGDLVPAGELRNSP